MSFCLKLSSVSDETATQTVDSVSDNNNTRVIGMTGASAIPTVSQIKVVSGLVEALTDVDRRLNSRSQKIRPRMRLHFLRGYQPQIPTETLVESASMYRVAFSKLPAAAAAAAVALTEAVEPLQFPRLR